MTSEEENKDTARQLYEGSLDEITEQIPDRVTEDAVLHDPVLGDVRGNEAITEYYSEISEGMEDARSEIEDLIAEGDKVTVRWTFSGVHEGPLPGVETEPTGDEVTFSGIDVLRFEDGKIAECWSEFDSLGLMQQLGVVSADAVSPEAV